MSIRFGSPSRRHRFPTQIRFNKAFDASPGLPGAQSNRKSGLTYSSDGRVMWITLADNRHAPVGPISSDSKMIALFKTMVAYAGKFIVEGDEVTHNVDASWNEA